MNYEIDGYKCINVNDAWSSVSATFAEVHKDLYY